MRWILRIAVFVAAAAAFLVLPGCPGTDVLVVDTGETVVVVQSKNTGASRYDIISLSISQLDLRPVDPDADAALGPNPIGLLSTPVFISNLADATTIPGPAIHSGQYRVVRIALQGIVMTDNNPPASPATCMENFGVVPDPKFPIGVGVIQFSDLGNPVVSVSLGGGQITVLIDEPELVAAFEASFQCRSLLGESCFFGRVTFDAPCLASFTGTTLQAAAPNIFSFQ